MRGFLGFTRIFVSIIIFSVSFNLYSTSKKMSNDFPQTAAAEALAKIDRGLNEKHPKMVLGGVFDYSEAKISISNDNFPKVIAKIDSVIVEERNVAARSVLYGYEALMFDS